MNTTSIPTDLTSVLGLDGLNDQEKAVFLAEIGDTVMETALAKFVAELDDEREAALEHYLESEPDSETLVQYLFTTHPAFVAIFEAEVNAFQEEAVAVLGNPDSDSQVAEVNTK